MEGHKRLDANTQGPRQQEHLAWVNAFRKVVNVGKQNGGEGRQKIFQNGGIRTPDIWTHNLPLCQLRQRRMANQQCSSKLIIIES